MASSLEARVPLLDHELVEFAFALPPGLKVRKGVGKYIFKKAMSSSLLPEHIAFREKQGFSAPIREWFKGDLGRRAEQTIENSALRELGLLDYEEIRRIWAAHRSGPLSCAFELWTLFTLSTWFDCWIA
jgi:asparagine synthase (glutamine-hydrolysing)